MYSNDEYEEETNESQSSSFLGSFYNNNKKLIWIAIGIIIVILVLSLLTRGNSSNNTKDFNAFITYNGEKTEKESISVNNTLRLIAKIEGLNNSEFEWTSSNTNVATVDDNGFVKAVGMGTTTITAIYKNNRDVKASCEITVGEGDPNVLLTSVSFPGDVVISVGSKMNIDLSAYPSKGYIENREFKSDDPTVATVDDNGLLTATGLGTATITASVNDGKFTSSMKVYVMNSSRFKNNKTYDYVISANNVQFTGSLQKIKEGEISKLNYTISPNNADLSWLTWESSDINIVKIDENSNGSVIGVKKGTAIIRVYNLDGNEVGNTTVEVEEDIIEVSSIVVPSYTITMVQGTQQEFVPTVKPDDASNKNLIFESSDSSVVTVLPPTGIKTVLYALKEGSTTITVTSDNGIKGYVMVNVTSSQGSGGSGGSGGSSSSGCSGGSMYSSRGYTISSRDNSGSNQGWMNDTAEKAQNQSRGAVSPLTISFSICDSNTDELRICYINTSTGANDCDVNSSGKVIKKSSADSSIILRNTGVWLVKVAEYSNGTLRRGPDNWYGWIQSGTTGGSGTATSKCYCNSNGSCTWTTSGSSSFPNLTSYTETQCKNRVVRSCCVRGSDGKYSIQSTQSMNCLKDTSGNYITNSTTCNNKNTLPNNNNNNNNNNIKPTFKISISDVNSELKQAKISINNPSSTGNNSIYFCVGLGSSKAKSSSNATLKGNYYVQESGTCRAIQSKTEWVAIVPKNTKICVSVEVDGVSSSDSCYSTSYNQSN